MSKKKITLTIMSIVIAILIMIIPNIAKASTTLTTPLYFGINEFRNGTTPDKMGYAIFNPYANGATEDSIVGTKIWQIVKYDSKTSNNMITGNYYCVRAGVGFSDTNKRAEYTIAYDLKTEKDKIEKSGNTVLNKIVTNGQYNNLLALADLVYLKGVSTDSEKTALLNAAGIYAEDYDNLITNSDIEAVQQAAFWYYTNHDDSLFDKLYNQFGEDKTSWLFYRTEEMAQQDSPYTSLSDYDLHFDSTTQKQVGAGKDRQEQAVLLYNYLITKANENAAGYANGTTHSNTKVTLYANPTVQNTQPIILIERTPDTREFDLALRKYITKVNGKDLTGVASRVPNIDKSTLTSGTTATYKHKKDPVVVTTGSTVTYKLTVYNEGQKAGRATKIVDQLPTGLKMKTTGTVTSSKGNSYTVAYDETANKATFTTAGTKDLAAYSGSTLDSDTIEIECTVTATATATANTSSAIVLTNVAWISEEYDSVDKITITNQKGKDRDSEPSTVPNKNKDNMSDYTGNNNKSDLTDSSYYYKGQQDDDDFEKLVLKPKTFDLRLIKRIVEVNGTKVPERLLSVDVTKLANGTATTADYERDKDPVSVKNGDIVKYTLRVYNEGEIDGYASEISEDIPEGLEFMWSENKGNELDADTTLTQVEKDAIKYNQGIWDMKTINQDTHKVELITTDYLAKGKGAEIATDGANLIKAFDKSKGYVNTINDKNPDYREVSVYMKVTASNDEVDKIIRNEAAITGDTDENGNSVDDRDSKPEEWKKYEDDEDFDNIKVQSFDLALRKFIVAVSQDEKIEDSDYLKDSNGAYTRAPKVDTSKLNTVGEDGKLITTATYNHPKTPVEVCKNDIVVYMLRVYNEGSLDGYASEIKDHLPSYLTYVNGDFNNKYGWKVSEDGRTISTNYLDNSLIEKATSSEDGKITLSYKEVPIMCQVTSDAQGKITNIADITKYKDENKKDITDRDSKENNVILPADKDLPAYKDDQTGDYIPGQEDDDDFEKLVVKQFDLALRKFITNISDKDVTSRIPQVKYDKDNKKITYEHTKDPLDVVTGDIVTYTIRVFNEGEVDGYASKVSDDVPDGLEYLPDNNLNKEYRWVMYDKDGKETTDVKNAVKLTTDYLSKEQGEARMAANSELKENPALLTAFDGTKEISDTNPDYADVKIAFKVTEPNGSSKILVNSAQITDDTDKNGKDVDDIDSTPDKWVDGEDDQDKEYIKLTEFDLALRKWVTQAIVIENGKETVTQTGHKAEDDPEQVVKVELNRKKLNSVTVKFRYSIRVTNEGDIAGYAKQIKDYIPEGLKFDAKDNPDWKDEGNNIITTRKLENTLLQPGQSAEVEVLLTWKNNKNNLGLKVNTAEISEDYNEKHVHDKDSTPNNKVPGEDDIDDAPVLLSISTGAAKLYIALSCTVLITLAGGIVLIKKFVL
ncbi:serine-aspartate repeat-containing protein D [Clostridium sp. CAG:470]|jgi:uncharacterized repeat protein (TIGR01451 family)|nr:MAG: hypothetical protein BHW03_00525 [Clostridium sp. 28_17]CDE14513.1 serine-aspartate repeat-containing protein D [Clostridium sp. CAG:470]